MKEFTPLYDKVLVQPDAPEAKSAGGILLPETSKEAPQEGIVKSLGDGAVTLDGTLRPLRVKEGDRVLFPKFTGAKTVINGLEYILMKESDIMGIIND